MREEIAAPGFAARLPSAARVLGLILLLQVVIALAVFSESLWQTIRRVGQSQVESVPTAPISPGNQRRPFQPGTVPANPDLRRPPQQIEMPRNPPMKLSFEVEEQETLGRVLLLAGGLEEGAAARFRGFLGSLEEAVDLVALHSPGGRVAEALEIGATIREAGLATAVFADAACLSACPYILAGGTERLVSRQAWVGLHQHSYDASTILPAFLAVEQIQAGQGATLAYLGEMGIDPLVLAHGLSTPPEEIYLLVEEELLKYRVATEMLP